MVVFKRVGQCNETQQLRAVGGVHTAQQLESYDSVGRLGVTETLLTTK